MIKIEFIGYLGKDAEVKNYGDREVLVFSVGANNGKDADGNRRTEWLLCTWRVNALSQYLRRGTQVFVRGRLHVETSIYKGEPSTSLFVSVDELELCGSRQAQDAPALPQQQAQNHQGNASARETTDELPF